MEHILASKTKNTISPENTPTHIPAKNSPASNFINLQISSTDLALLHSLARGAENRKGVFA